MSANGIYPAEEFASQLAERRKFQDRLMRIAEVAGEAAVRLEKVAGEQFDRNAFWRKPVEPSGTGFPDFSEYVKEADRLLAAHKQVTERRATAQKKFAQLDAVVSVERTRRRQKAVARIGLLLLFIAFVAAFAIRGMMVS